MPYPSITKSIHCMRRIVVAALLLSLLPATNTQAATTDALTALNNLEV